VVDPYRVVLTVSTSPRRPYRVVLIASSLSRRPHRVVLIALPLLLFIYCPYCSILSILLFSIESFVTITDRASRRGGSSYASSSRARGKAPAVPQKRISKVSTGRKRKRAKTTADIVKVESLTYHEPESELEPELVPEPMPEEPKRIKLNGQWYRKVTDLAGQRRGKKKSSHI